MEDWTIRAYGGRSGEVLELIRGIIATQPEARSDELMILTRGGHKRVWNFVTSGLGTQSDGRRLFVFVARDVTDGRACFRTPAVTNNRNGQLSLETEPLPAGVWTQPTDY
jgi:hypothetical protein